MIFPNVVLIVSITVMINGHGRLMNPPSRNAMWRLGFKNPPNYDDNGLFCGGFSVQFQVNNGKCGVCGDDFRDAIPRRHEDGGEYGNGIIGKTYTVGQEIPIEVLLTANHKGKMQLKICPRESGGIVTQECLDSTPLNIVGQDTSIFEIPANSNSPETFKWTVKLPDGLKCEQCVIQWTYTAGNNWGYCADGTAKTGCGNQETFVNCADVAILDELEIPLGRTVLVDDTEAVKYQVCNPTPEFEKDKEVENFCRNNCMTHSSYCPLEKCKCWESCEAIEEFSKIDMSNAFCNQYCLNASSTCPEDKCICV